MHRAGFIGEDGYLVFYTLDAPNTCIGSYVLQHSIPERFHIWNRGIILAKRWFGCPLRERGCVMNVVADELNGMWGHTR